MKSRVRLSLLLPILAILTACGPAAAAITPATAPTPKGFDLGAWDVITVGTGSAATEANGGVNLFFAAKAQGDPQQQAKIAVTLKSKCQMSGDFDLQVDYALVNWPARNGVRFGLGADVNSVQRASNPHSADNTYTTEFSGHIVSVETPDKSGRLRLTRVGTTVTGYYLSNRTWVQIDWAAASTVSAGYAIEAWTDAYSFGGQDVRVNLKNLTATGCS